MLFVLHLSVFLSPQGAIIIHEVYEEGAASKDGRLWAGDQILEVPSDTTKLTSTSLLVKKKKKVIYFF